MNVPSFGQIILEAPVLEPNMKQVGRSPNSNRVIIETNLINTSEKNRNGRVYEDEEMDRALLDPRLKELLDTQNLKAEDGHPLDKTLQRQQTIFPPNTCAKFLSIWKEGKIVKGRVKGTMNDRGEYFNNDILDGEIPSWSLRALGSLQEKGGRMCVRNLRIITWDRVIYPSHKIAYMTKIVNENATMAGMGENQFVYNESWAGEVTPIVTEDVLDYIRHESANLKLFCETFEALGNTVSIVENGTKVQIMTSNGDIARLNLERYIQNEIMDYCCK